MPASFLESDAVGQPPSLPEWLRAQGCTWSPALDLRVSSTYTAVYAAEDIPADTVLCSIAKTAVLSVRTTGISALLAQEQLGGGLGLIIALLYEASRGAESPWHGYLASLPRRAYVPLFWDEAELARLQGTSLGGDVVAAEAALVEGDWAEHVAPLVAAHPALLRPAPAFSLARYRDAASLVSSRAFGVDSAHGMSLVPLADAFNHKAARCRYNEGYEIEPAAYGGSSSSGSSDGSLCEEGEDGEEQGGESDEEAQGQHSPGESKPAEGPHEEAPPGGGASSSASEGEPLGDGEGASASEGEQGGPRKRRRVMRGAILSPADAERPELRLDIAICGAVTDDGRECLQIVAAAPLQRGQEVFNTYGEHTNAELVMKFGFALRGNAFDSVALPKAALVGAVEGVLGPEQTQHRAAFLEEHSHLLEDGREPFELLPGARLLPTLLVTLHAFFVSDDALARHGTLDGLVASLLALQTPGDPGRASPAPGGVNGHACEGAEAPEDGRAGPASGEGGEEAAGEEELQVVDVRTASRALLGDDACRALLVAVSRQMQGFGEAPAQCVQQVEPLCGSAREREHAEAVLAATVLREGELCILREVREALEARIRGGDGKKQ